MAETSRARRLTARLRRRGTPPDLRDRIDLLTDRITDDIFATIPAYRNADPGFRPVVRAVVRRIVAQVIDLFREQRLATRHEVRELVNVCVPPTEQGITLEDMLEVFHRAQEVLWWELHRLVDEDELVDPQMSLELSHLGVHLITALSRGVTSAYLRGDRVWLDRRDAERALLRAVLDAPSRIEEATRACHALDLRLFGTWQCAVYEARSGGVVPDELARRVDEARRRAGVPGAVAVLGATVTAVVQAEQPPPPPPENGRAGIGGRHTGAPGLRTSYEEAREALDVAKRRDLEVLDASHARLDRVFMGSLSTAQLADEVLAPLDNQPDGRREMLAETLEAWLDEGGSVTATARRLQLHPQSARYRIERLREVFGDILDDPDGRLQLHLAVKSLRLSAQQP